MSAKFTTSADSVLDGLESMSPAEQAAALDALAAQSRDDIGTLRGLRNLVQLPDGNFNQSVIGLGDSFGQTSLGTFFGFEQTTVLVRGSYRCSQATGGGDSGVTTHSVANGNADYTKSPDGIYYEIASGGNLTCAHLHTGAQGLANTGHYTLFPGTGTAQMQYSESGQAWTNVGSAIDTTAITTVQIGDITLPAVGQFRLRLVASGGTVNGWLGQSLNGGSGIMWTGFSLTGQSIGQSCTVPEAVWKAMVTGYSADLVMVAFADGRYNDATTSPETWAIGIESWAADGPIDSFYQWSKTSNSAIDWMIVGPHKVDPAVEATPNATLDALYEAIGVGTTMDARIKDGAAVARQWALDNGEGYFDSYNLFPSFAEAFADGMFNDEASDIHLSAKGRATRVAALFERTNLARVFGVAGKRVGDLYLGAGPTAGAVTTSLTAYNYAPGANTTLASYTGSEFRSPVDASGLSGSYFKATSGGVSEVGIYSGSAFSSRFVFNAANFLSYQNNGGSLGSSSVRWANAWLTALNVSAATAPSSASDTGTAGEIRFDSDYMYRCTATNTWKRTALSTW